MDADGAGVSGLAARRHRRGRPAGASRAAARSSAAPTVRWPFRSIAQKWGAATLPLLRPLVSSKTLRRLAAPA
jgi:hypothetical protein